MSDDGQGCASIGAEVWKASQKWSEERSAVRSIAWLDERASPPAKYPQKIDANRSDEKVCDKNPGGMKKGRCRAQRIRIITALCASRIDQRVDREQDAEETQKNKS